MRALGCYYAAGFEPKVLVTITALSLPDLEELLCLLVQKKITRINLNGFRLVGRGHGHGELMANNDQIRAAVRRAQARCYPDQAVPPDAPELETQANCGVGQFLNIMPDGDVFPCHVLTDREFRCGNLREQNLLEICQRNSLLGQLAALDFHKLARDAPLASLTSRGTCMGNIYAATRSLPIWNNHLSLCSDTREKYLNSADAFDM